MGDHVDSMDHLRLVLEWLQQVCRRRMTYSRWPTSCEPKRHDLEDFALYFLAAFLIQAPNFFTPPSRAHRPARRPDVEAIAAACARFAHSCPTLSGA